MLRRLRTRRVADAPRAPRTSRAGAGLTGLVAALAGVGLLAVAPSARAHLAEAAATAAAPASTASTCLPGGGAAAAGGTGPAARGPRDPHHFTAEQTAASIDRLNARLRAKGYRVDATGRATRGDISAQAFTPVTVPVYVHVITDGIQGRSPEARSTGS